MLIREVAIRTTGSFQTAPTSTHPRRQSRDYIKIRLHLKGHSKISSSLAQGMLALVVVGAYSYYNPDPGFTDQTISRFGPGPSYGFLLLKVTPTNHKLAKITWWCSTQSWPVRVTIAFFFFYNFVFDFFLDFFFLLLFVCSSSSSGEGVRGNSSCYINFLSPARHEGQDRRGRGRGDNTFLLTLLDHKIQSKP